MKIPARAKSRIRQRKRLTSNAEGRTPDVDGSNGSTLDVGRLAFGVLFISSSATLPTRLRGRPHPTAVLPCAGDGQLPGSRCSLGCYNRRLFFCRAPMPL